MIPVPFWKQGGTNTTPLPVGQAAPQLHIDSKVILVNRVPPFLAPPGPAALPIGAATPIYIPDRRVFVPSQQPYSSSIALQGNPDILLWVPFTDGTAKDVSIYNRTPNATITGGAATVGASGLAIDITSVSPDSFTAQIAYLIQPTYTTLPKSVPLTFEGFVTWNTSPPNTLPFEIFSYAPKPTVGAKAYWNFDGYSSAGKVQVDDAPGLNPVAGPTGSNVLAPAGTTYHWAWIIPAVGDNVNRFYVNGVQVLTYTTGRVDQAIDSDGCWRIGGAVGTNGTGNHVKVTLGETRVSAANLYPNGTSFTPPTPGNLPPVP